MDNAGVAGVRVAVGVQGGDRDIEGVVGRAAAAYTAVGRARGGGVTDRDRARGAGDGAGDGIGAGDGLAARRLEADAVGERVNAGIAADERVVGWQGRLPVAAGEVNDAGVAGVGVAVGVQGG